MRNISIKFNPYPNRSQFISQRKKIKEISHSANLITSKKFYQVQYIFKKPLLISAHKINFNTSKQTDSKKKMLYKSMMLNLQKTYVSSKQLHSKQISFGNQKDRGQIIHSRKSPRCNLFQRRASLNTNTSYTSREEPYRNCINLIDPQNKAVVGTPITKRISESSTRQSFSKTQRTNEQLFLKKPMKSQPESPRRKFWGKNYRPWSPSKQNIIGIDQFCESIDHFVQFSS